MIMMIIWEAILLISFAGVSNPPVANPEGDANIDRRIILPGQWHTSHIIGIIVSTELFSPIPVYPFEDFR